MEPGDYFTADELGLDTGYGAPIEANIFDDASGELHAAVTFTDYSAFHRERHPELFDDDGWITVEAAWALDQEARERYDADLEYNGGDDPHVQIVLTFPVTPEMTPTDLGERAWPMVAKILNETDPGTFGCPYLYDELTV